MRIMYARLDPDHRVVPCTLEEWGTLFSWEPGCFEKERRVAWTGLVGAEVSTVFLGLNHAYADGADEWFETLVFGGAARRRARALRDLGRGHCRPRGNG